MSLLIGIIFGAIAVAVIAVIAYLVVDHGRFLKTIYLIARISPFEQAGTGAGSVLVIGDSTGYGTGATNKRATIAGRIGTDFTDYKITNWSVNGDTFADATKRVREQLLVEYDLILLQLGGNDILQKRSVVEIEKDARTLFELLDGHTDHIVLISSGNVGTAPAFSGEEAQMYTELTRDYHERMEQLAATHEQLTYVNLYQPPAEDPFSKQPDRYMAWDGLHPSDEGYGLWYASLAPVIKKHLTKNPST